ncbi:MAG TPA: hypothetical protein VN610_06280 [Bryobacteraceae bacterium]|nr:hypothetical protein [Bryobacteraceae bacterium]
MHFDYWSNPFRIRSLAFGASVMIACLALPLSAQNSITIRVDATSSQGPLKPIWSYFGADEPNYTYMKNGRKLLGELSALSPVPVYFRTHNLLTTGDGIPSLKWGSTNAYTEDISGKPVYSWTILDRIFDNFRDTGIRPLVEVGFMPEALSTHPKPYRHNFPNGPVFTGWSYPPNDYGKWSELIYQWTRHMRERYGDAALKTWLWEVWNEPDIAYWHGTQEEYFKLYDYSADAIKRAYPDARVGGPDTTGPAGRRSGDFLRAFLEHCARGKNYATGKTGSPLAFISFHPKGSPKIVNGHLQMGISHHLLNIERGFEIVTSSPERRNTPIILGESDPEGCAACSARVNPANAYRNGPLYAVYTAEVLNNIYDLAARTHANIGGVVTWAFEFENQPYFDGFRALATNGIDKAVLNAFRMFGLLGNERVAVTSSGAVPPERIVSQGVRDRADISALASRGDREISILVWNYHDDAISADAANINLNVNGLPAAMTRVLLEHYRIDQEHSNAYAVWQSMGSPPSPSPAQYATLEAAGQLQQLTSPAWLHIANGAARLEFALPREALSLIRLTW